MAELYEALAEGLAGLVCPRSLVRRRCRRKLKVRSEDVELLAVDFLSRLLALMQTEGFCVRDVKVTEAAENNVAATLLGESLDTSRHQLGEEIKAVTYHMLKVCRREGRWVGRVLLDL